ncbi:MDR family NADP-dependent oxidoreductase [Burkholderia stagnalis]|uniref:MDR family NADP-dependent oxidoreductase n=1 Tax=Burkholderia stagnalis TaxID=1503054 RepID=UPI000753E36F|nr:NADP-dependent oxidoreductase [Burkholderia stagnalis]KVN17310.1 NADP-dependent oxidoreductase [Burkholderia stagnalis]KWI29500.1 NADP-dependent oxidoreductase [Burkholderia stagnalis]KWI70269.1 NADP-dependent oxidoreductase [Burkholderia stagnalis]RQQ35684.1 NADP-dependent oxidoreductase [Burkholderia stagnalis]RQQ39343.1 NADP-dependent oxidoreductase [Burkholderia stagnalis]
MNEIEFHHSPPHNRLVHQVERPHGEPRRENFRFVRQPLAELSPGEALVRNLHFSVDPYMRECMDGDWDLNAPLEGRTIGQVLRTTDSTLKPGDWVFHRQGWRTYAHVRAQEVRVIRPAAGVPLSTWLSILGGTGLTAWVALTRIARLQRGDSVYISAAAGGVGTAAGQFARLLGARRIIGSTRTEDKARQLTNGLGYTDAFVYRPGQVSAQLRELIPEGIDVYLDNVGGEQLEAAIDSLKDYGRAALIGAVAQYSALQAPAAPRNLFDVVGKSLTLQGFLVKNHVSLQQELEEFAIPHLQRRDIVAAETITQGFDHIVDAFLSMLAGGNLGKAIVSIDPADIE